jgi:mannose-6-phosphate isomerase-like protein (cupin superfamily)
VDEVVAPGAGEVIGDAPDRRVEILCEQEPLHATWSRFGPRREGADLHVHHRHTDLFYVLVGALTVRLGIEDEPVAVPAGTLARVPPNVVHGFRNGSDAEVRYLNLHAPGQGFADFLRGLRDSRAVSYDQHEPPENGGRPTSEAVIGGGEAGKGVVTHANEADLAVVEWLDGHYYDTHVHRRHVEALYVLEGELALMLGDRELLAPGGTWVTIPPGVPHACVGDARFLELHAPGGGFGWFIRGDAPHFDQTPV